MIADKMDESEYKIGLRCIDKNLWRYIITYILKGLGSKKFFFFFYFLSIKNSFNKCKMTRVWGTMLKKCGMTKTLNHRIQNNLGNIFVITVSHS